VFWAAAVPGALSVFVAALGIRETKNLHPSTSSGQAFSQNQGEVGHPQERASAEQKNVQHVGTISSAGLPITFYSVLAAVTLFSLGNSSDMFLVMRAQNVGISVSLAPLLGLVFNVTYTLGSWPAGWLSDHFSRRWIAAAGYLTFGAVYLVFGRAPSILAIWIIMAVYGIYYALTQPVLKALVVETVAQQIRGRALGIYFFFTSVATLAASLISGELWKHYGPSIPFYVSAGLALISALILMASPVGRRTGPKALLTT
jgi:MFS family permease